MCINTISTRFHFAVTAFITGCICEYYTGRRIDIKYNEHGNIMQKEIKYMPLKGTGIGYGFIIAVLVL